MIRTLTGIGFALALVGSAHAQDNQVTITLQGKTLSTVRSQIYKAAEKVCASDTSPFDQIDETCVEATYEQAMQSLRATPRIVRTAYASPRVPR